MVTSFGAGAIQDGVGFGDNAIVPIEALSVSRESEGSRGGDGKDFGS